MMSGWPKVCYNFHEGDCLTAFRSRFHEGDCLDEEFLLQICITYLDGTNHCNAMRIHIVAGPSTLRIHQ